MYPDPNSRSAELFRQANQYIPGGLSRDAIYFSPYPVYVARGQGCRVMDVDGVERLDLVNNMSSIIVGHSHPQVVKAVQEQAASIMGVGMPSEAEIGLAKLICNRLPAVDRIRFTNSGTEGVMFAIRAARAYTGKQKIGRMEGGYNGSIDCMETSRVRSTPDNWGPAERPATTLNNRGIPKSVIQDIVTLPFNDVEATRRLLEENAHDLAGVLIDPYPGRLAFAPASHEFLTMLREFTRDNGSALIYDEVFCSRAGYRFAQGHCGVLPDLTALGKIIGGGLPIGAVAGSEEFMSVFDQSHPAYRLPHSGTYNANPMSMAAGLAAMNIMTPDAYDHIGALGERLRKGLSEALAVAGVPGCVQGLASMSFLWVGNEGPIGNHRDLINKPHDSALQMALHHYLLDHGVQSGDALAWLTSLPMTEADIDFAVEQTAAGLMAVRHSKSYASAGVAA